MIIEALANYAGVFLHVNKQSVNGYRSIVLHYSIILYNIHLILEPPKFMNKNVAEIDT